MPGLSKWLQAFFGEAKWEHLFLRWIFFACLINRWELGATFILIFRCLPAHRDVGTVAGGSSRCPVAVRSSKASTASWGIPGREFHSGDAQPGITTGGTVPCCKVTRQELSCPVPFTLGLDPVQCLILDTHCTLPTFHWGPGMEEVFQRQSHEKHLSR